MANQISANDFLHYHISIRNIFKNVLRVDKTPISQYEILLLVKESPSMKVGEISSIMNITRPNLTPLIEDLSQKGYLKKPRDETDKRIVRVQITKEGEKYLEAQTKEIDDRIQQFEKEYSKEEIEEINKALKDIKDILSSNQK